MHRKYASNLIYDSNEKIDKFKSEFKNVMNPVFVEVLLDQKRASFMPKLRGEWLMEEERDG